MKDKTVLKCIAAWFALFAFAASSVASAGTVAPVAPVVRGPVPPSLSNCTAEALNVSGFVGTDGSISVYNIPTNQGQVRVRVTCQDAGGKTVTGQSPLTNPIPGFSLDIGSIDFSGAPAPATLSLGPRPVGSDPATTLAVRVSVGTTQQLSVGATFADLSTGDVTPASSGTVYQTSNPAVATVSANGLVTGVSGGTAIVFALYDGAVGFAGVTVLPASVSSVSSVPSTVSIGLSPLFPAPPVQLHVTATLSDASTLDVTPSSTGVTYHSSNPLAAQVTTEGLVIGLAGGITTITATDPSGMSTDVPVLVTAFSPTPEYAWPTPGFAYNADIEGTLAYVADGASGLLIMDTTNGSTVGQINYGGGINAVDVRLRGTLGAVALSTGGFSLVDITNPVLPFELKRVVPIAGGDVHDVWFSGDTLYVAVAGQGMYAYGVSDPKNPVLLGNIGIQGAVAVAGDSTRKLAVVLDSQPTLWVVDMSGSPWTTASVALPLVPGGNGRDVVLYGTDVWAACARAGVSRVDIIDPAHPRLVTSTNALGADIDALGVAVHKSAQGTLIAVGDDRFVNGVPMYPGALNTFFNLDFCTSPACSLNGSPFPGDWQANGTGIALGTGFGVETVGPDGIQVFLTEPLVDNAGVPPTVWLTSPAQGSSVPLNRFVTAAARATDDVAVASVQIYANGKPITTSGSSPWTAFFMPAATGPLTITAQATDLGGNVGTSLPVTIQITDPVQTVNGCGAFSGQVGTVWETRATGPAQNGEPGWSSLNPGSNFYSVGGTSFARYDNVSNTWINLASLPLNVEHYNAPAFVNELSVYEIGAGAVQVYSIPSDTWTIANAQVPQTLYSQTAHDDSGNIYAMGNFSNFACTSGQNVIPFVVQYNIASNTVKTLPFTFTGTAQQNETCEPRLQWDSCTQKLYIAPSFRFGQFYSYDPVTSAQTTLAPNPDQFMNDTFCGDRSGHIYAAGNPSGTQMYKYDIQSNTWAHIPNLPFDHGDNGSCAITGDGFLFQTPSASAPIARITIQ